MMRRILLSLCVVLVVAAPASAGRAEHGLRGLNGLRGTVSSVASDGIVVKRGDLQVTCALGKRSPSIENIQAGDRVAVLCRGRRHRLVLVAVKKLDDAPPAARSQGSAIAGKITVLADGSVTVHNDENDRTLACSIPDRYASLAQKLEVGDRVAMLCAADSNAGTPQLVKLLPLDRQQGGDSHKQGKPVLADIAGRVTAVGGGNITIGNGDGGRTLTCTVPDTLAVTVATLAVGDSARMVCRDGALVAIRKGGAPPTTPPASPPAPQSFSFTGPLTLVSHDRVAVTVGADSRSCYVPEGPLRDQLSGFTLGQVAVLSCTGPDAGHAKLTAIAHAGSGGD
jgi:hypothetical protein